MLHEYLSIRFYLVDELNVFEILSTLIIAFVVDHEQKFHVSTNKMDTNSYRYCAGG